MHSFNQKIDLPILRQKGITLFIKREDVIHPYISGNKFRKLKYNLLAAEEQKQDTLLTFGGAFSNHILATANAGKEHGFRTIGVIRGAELQDKWAKNPTLQLAAEFGMQFHFVTRETYRLKDTPDFLRDLKGRFGDFYLLPEGGGNTLAVKGCEEILTNDDAGFDYICSSVGTGGTMAGLINSAKPHQRVLGFAALKGDFLNQDICNFARSENWKLVSNYHFGGYAKITVDLVHFINDFKNQTGIALDPIYTGKMLYGIIDRVKSDKFEGESRILAIHTGGLQGIRGMNLILKKKKLPLLHI